MGYRKPQSKLSKAGFTQKDQHAAKKEGWMIRFYAMNESDKPYIASTLAESHPFKTHDAAEYHVTQRMREGSMLHARAMRVIIRWQMEHAGG